MQKERKELESLKSALETDRIELDQRQKSLEQKIKICAVKIDKPIISFNNLFSLPVFYRVQKCQGTS